MPHYHPADIGLSLRVSDLSLSTTAEPVLRRADATANAKIKTNFESAEAALRSGTTLSERPILCHGERYHLSFLGGHEHMPFMMVHAGKDLFKTPEADESQPTPRQLRRLRTPVVDKASEVDDASAGSIHSRQPSVAPGLSLPGLTEGNVDSIATQTRTRE